MREALALHPALLEALLYAARRHVPTQADAEDLFQETIRVGLTRSDPPDTEDVDAVRRYFGSIMNGLGANRRRAAHRREETPYDDDAPATTEAGAPNALNALIAFEDEAAWREAKAALRAALADEPIACRMLDLAEEGVRTSAEFAQRIGCSVEDIYRAQRRIRYHARKIQEAAAQRGRNE